MTLKWLQLPSCTDMLCYELTCIKVLVMRLSILSSMHIQRITHHIHVGLELPTYFKLWNVCWAVLLSTGAMRRARDVQAAFPIPSPMSASEERSQCSNGEATVNGLADTFVFVVDEVDDGRASVSCPRTCVFSRLEF